MTKVLIIRFSSIGDIVLTTPVVRNLFQQMYEGAEIHFLTKTQFKSLLEPNPYIAKVYGIEKSTNEVIEDLKEERYDYVIDLHMNLRSARVKRSLKMISFSFKKYNWQKWLLVNFGINKMPKVHIVDRYMETLKPFSIENDGKGLDYFFPEGEDAPPSELPQSHKAGYIAVAIGAAHWRKKPRLKQYIEICQKINNPIILLGGPSEKEGGNEIASACGSKVWNAAGKFNLNGSASLIRDSKLVITPDTGMMHIASAFKKPIISFWGATVPDFGMYPYLNENLDERISADHLGKRPCSKLGTKCKYKECLCIDELPISKAIEVANSQIAPLTP
ncbi:glycosyltransferase family 9 protein [Cryomorphaceae bacterium 1068]|nr:glycosyltransferase family 9 protein [Cryomorphaceae bacterium 1068]